MKVILSIIVLFLTTTGNGQDSLLNKIPVKYSKDCALISIVDLKYFVGLSDIDLNYIPENTFALIPLQTLYRNQKAHLEKMIKENTTTNDPDWKTKQKILLDTLENILSKDKSIYLNNNNYKEVYKLLNKYSINDFLNKKRLVLLHKRKDGNYENLKYRDRRIGAWHHFKMNGQKDEFYLYYTSSKSGTIYQGCYDGRSTFLGRIIMSFQRIGW